MSSSTDLELELTRNGLAYLQRSVEEGDDQADLQTMAFAITDLAIAVEVLLKARLAREHWTLIFTKPDTVKRADMLAGTAKTVGPDEAFKRLENISGVPWRPTHSLQVTRLVTLRNRVMHFTPSGMAVQALMAPWGEALDFALWLLSNEFDATDSPRSAQLVRDVEEAVSTRLGELGVLVKTRLASLADRLASAEVLVQCPRCTQPTLVLGEGDPVRCLYCFSNSEYQGPQVADLYVELVLNKSSYSTAKDGEDWPVHVCLECDREALVAGIEPVPPPTAPSTWAAPLVHYGCFECGIVYAHHEVERCARCHTLTSYEVDGSSLCQDCVADYYDEFLASE